MENKMIGHIVSIKPDKSLLSEINLFLIDSSSRTDRRVYFYATEIFEVSDTDGKDEKIFFMPVLPVVSTDGDNPSRIPVPIFMLDFSLDYRNEIMEFGKKVGLEILPKHFEKPKISITYEERIEINDGEPEYEIIEE